MSLSCHPVHQESWSLDSSILIHPLITAKLLMQMEIRQKDVVKKKNLCEIADTKAPLFKNHSSEA